MNNTLTSERAVAVARTAEAGLRISREELEAFKLKQRAQEARIVTCERRLDEMDGLLRQAGMVPPGDERFDPTRNLRSLGGAGGDCLRGEQRSHA